MIRKNALSNPAATQSDNPLRAKYYADSACGARVRVVENTRIAQDTYRLRIECPEIASRIVPGQFLMVRLADCDDPLLGRALALFDTVPDNHGKPRWVDVVYLKLGKMTSLLAESVPGRELDVWGPLGNGFPPVTAHHLIMVAGGIGVTPFLALAQEYFARRQYGKSSRIVSSGERATLCYGVRTANLVSCVDDFDRAGVDIHTSSDDGTIGHHGFVTDLLNNVLAESAGEDRLVVCCGPEPMMEAVAHLCHQAKVSCQVSLETPMACGVGICFSCVAKVQQPDGNWDYKRTCVEGPIFDAEKIVW